jgi:tetratricopeptide (TPR) repeat protein
MSSKDKVDSMGSEIERALMPGGFVQYDDMFRFVEDLERVRDQLVSMVAVNARQALPLYEIFLSGCYDKIEECDDSGGSLAMFFHSLFCGWIEARQKSKRPARETVEQILKWMERDDYGFCYQIEGDIVRVLDQEGYRLLVEHFLAAMETGLCDSEVKPPRAIFEYDNKIRLPALSLKEIYISKEAVQPYAELCERLGFSPRDCEHLAEMEMARQRWNQALAWVEKGLALEPARNWHNEGSYSLAQMKPKILGKLGRKEGALTQAWADFEADPCEMGYVEFMQFVPKDQKAQWRERALTMAEERDLGSFITLCVKTREWKRLAARVHAVKHSELEALSHYCTEPAARALAKKDARAAAKLHRALGLRILNSARSKYYDAALRHFESARKLYLKAGCGAEWQAVATLVQTEHSRKRGFLSDFLSIETNQHQPSRSAFVRKAEERWRKQTS